MNETYKKRFHTMEDQIRLLFEKVMHLEELVKSNYVCYNCGSLSVGCVESTDDTQVYHCSNCGAEITYYVGEYYDDCDTHTCDS